MSSQRSPGNFFRRRLSSGANCVALKVGTSCTRMILLPDAWTAEMHLSSGCVNYSFVNFFRGLSLSFPNSMSNLLIETGAIKTFPKTSRFKHSSGNFGPSSSSPFPKAQNLKQRSLKMFALRLFGKFMQLYPTPEGCHRFHFTHKVGP